MYCTNCGTKVLDGDRCPNCGQAIDKMDCPNSEQTNSKFVKSNKKKMNYAMIACGLLVTVMFFIAAQLVANGGTQIMQIESVGGKTLEEAYYFELGNIYAGYAMALRGMGIFFGVLLMHKGGSEKS